MILTNRLFTRRDPEKDAKSIYVFCEGKKREGKYFQNFERLDSKIKIVVYPLKEDEDNSPTGLYEIAKNCLVKSETHPSPLYELLEDDEVWFVIDTDRWGSKLDELRAFCELHHNWSIAQSNPCFEVWLYYHLFDTKAIFPWNDTCKEWKSFLPLKIPGGFDSSKHTIYIAQAAENAKNAFEELEGSPSVGSTEVFKLADVILAVCRRKIENIRHKI